MLGRTVWKQTEASWADHPEEWVEQNRRNGWKRGWAKRERAQEWVGQGGQSLKENALASRHAHPPDGRLHHHRPSILAKKLNRNLTKPLELATFSREAWKTKEQVKGHHRDAVTEVQTTENFRGHTGPWNKYVALKFFCKKFRKGGKTYRLKCIDLMWFWI